MAVSTSTVTLPDLMPWCDQAALSLTSAASHAEEPLEVCGQLMVSDARNNFQGSHDPDGLPWPPLKHPRANSKGGDKPLLDRGILEGSVQVQEVTGSYVSAGSNLDYSQIHNQGGTISYPERRRDKPWVFPGPDGKPIFTRRIRAHTVTIPMRKFSGWSDALLEKCGRVFGEWWGSKL